MCIFHFKMFILQFPLLRSVYPSLPLPCQPTADRGKRDSPIIYQMQMLLEVKGHLKELAERERETEGQQGLVAKERDEQVKMVSSY